MNRHGAGRPPTKAELVRLREQLAVARQGYELLENKRDILIQEGIRRLRLARQLRLHMTQQWQRLQDVWRDCCAHEGHTRLTHLARALPPAEKVEGRERTWMSASLAEFRYAPPGLSLLGAISDCSVRPERVRGLLASLLPDLLDLMNEESSVRRISQALRRCQRQVNALHHVLIPEMQAEQRRIDQHLEEKEREALFQIKQLKARRA
ncbi:MAG: V-type ATP synthase subunit D [Mariprofundaceae bacterium]